MLQQQLHGQIPPLRYLNVSIEQASARQTRLFADFASNKNLHNTLFGGSQALVATACAWLLVHMQFPQSKGNIVIRQSHMRFIAPGHGDLVATSTLEPARENDWRNCREMLKRFGRGSINVDCHLHSNGSAIAHFSGEFVVTVANQMA